MTRYFLYLAILGTILGSVPAIQATTSHSVSFAEAQKVRENEGGGWSGNGGGDAHAQDNTWFLGDKKVRYCIEAHDSYPLNKTQLEEMVEKGINQWITFFRKYNIGLPSQDNRLGAHTLPMALNFIYEDCKDETDLTFLFGLQNDVIRTYQALKSEDGIGLAIRRSFNHKTYWNPGYIWIDNFSSSHAKIKHLVLHELRHVFGLRHNSVHVMNENIGLKLKSDKFSESYFGSIESEYWPYSFPIMS